MPANIQTVHTLSDSITKEIRGRHKQAGINNPNNSKDLLIELTTKAQHGNHRSDSSTKPDNKHTADKEPIRVGRLSHKADTIGNDPPQKDKRTIVIKIANQSNHNLSGTDPGLPQQADGHTPPTKPKPAVEPPPHPIAQEPTAGDRRKQAARRERGDKAATLWSISPFLQYFFDNIILIFLEVHFINPKLIC